MIQRLSRVSIAQVNVNSVRSTSWSCFNGLYQLLIVVFNHQGLSFAELFWRLPGRVSSSKTLSWWSYLRSFNKRWPTTTCKSPLQFHTRRCSLRSALREHMIDSPLFWSHSGSHFTVVAENGRLSKCAKVFTPFFATARMRHKPAAHCWLDSQQVPAAQGRCPARD